jgi:hypothetical protein
VPQEDKEDMIAAEHPFLDVMWTMLVVLLWVIWFWLLGERPS